MKVFQPPHDFDCPQCHPRPKNGGLYILLAVAVFVGMAFLGGCTSTRTVQVACAPADSQVFGEGLTVCRSVTCRSKGSGRYVDCPEEVTP